VGDKGIDGRIFPVSALDNVREAGADELKLEERFYAMQVKQKDKAGRPDIDAFETAFAAPHFSPTRPSIFSMRAGSAWPKP
jgi:hypothetical protein